MKNFAMGDIHGAHKAMLQCFDRCGFDYDEDRLIVLGDVCDGYPEVRQSIDELLKVRHCQYIIGNHDLWALDWAQRGAKPEIWLTQGGANTIRSYGGESMPPKHAAFLRGARGWLKEEDRLFVHGGFDPNLPIEQQGLEILVWDRTLLLAARQKHLAGEEQHQFGPTREIFLGHTTTQQFHSMVPVHFCNVWAMDTGAGWSGKLTIMNVETKEYWQSDATPQLYGSHQGR